MSLFFLSLTKDLLKLHASFETRNDNSDRVSLIKQAIDNYKSNPMVKNAFDTRRINSETEVNPRRNLQNYQRSEPYISSEMSNNIKTLFKVKYAADQIREQFLGDSDWLNSNSRILCNSLNNTLRVEQKDYDFFKPQFDYLKEILFLRYKLSSEDINRMSDDDIKTVLLEKDERLLHKSLFSNYAPKEVINKVSEQPIPQQATKIVKQKENTIYKNSEPNDDNLYSQSNSREEKRSEKNNDGNKTVNITINV